MRTALLSIPAILALAVGPALAEEFDTALLTAMEAAATDMVQRGKAHYAEVGLAQAAEDFNWKTDIWYDADRYHVQMFGMGKDCILWADSVFPEFFGTDYCTLRDVNGFGVGPHVLENIRPEGELLRVEATFDNPDTGDLIPAIGMCAQVDAENIICAWTNG